MANTVVRPLRVDPDGTFDTRYWLRNDPLAAGPQGEPGRDGIDGEQGVQGPQGVQGEQGESGQAVRIRWIVSSPLDLPASNVEVGDGALVGVAAPYTLYVYTSSPSPQWHNAGVITAGPKGDKGETGNTGPVGPQPPLAGSGSATTASRSDHTHTGIYSPVTHTHTGIYSPVTHNHDDAYGSKAREGSMMNAFASPDGTSTDYDAVAWSNRMYFRGGLKNVHAAPDYLVIEVAFAGSGSASTASRSDHAHSAGSITSGTISRDRLPSLSADMVTSGTFGIARIPTIPISKLGGGTFGSDSIPNLNASKITAGVLGSARIPKQSVISTFPTNKSVTSGASVSVRVGPENTHAVIGTAAASHAVHDTGIRRTTDETWAYIFTGAFGFCWIPASRIS